MKDNNLSMDEVNNFNCSLRFNVKFIKLFYYFFYL